MSWALKRQLFYIAILVIFFSVLGYLIASPYINKLPTCTDNKKNGNEMGVDCGGSCVKACSFAVDKISVLWSRSFEVIPGRYNAVAYLENHNTTEVVSKINYRFRFSDKNNVFIGKREGQTFIPASGKFAIFEPGIGVGNSIPVYTTFEFTEIPVWTTVSEEKLKQLNLSIYDIKLENQDTSPHLSAIIKNDSLYTIPEVGVVVILYDEKGNAISASRTYIDVLSSGENKNIDFTWPQPIPGNVITKEIIPIYDISLVKLN